MSRPTRKLPARQKPIPFLLTGLATLGIGFITAGCTPRTLIHPTPPEERPAPGFVSVDGCNVRDFASATEVPKGARNLGWVTVEQQGTDEETFVALRKKICELGGDALSQPAWVKGPGDEQPRLTANAWALP